MSDDQQQLLKRKNYLFAGLSITCLISLWMLSSSSNVITTPKNILKKQQPHNSDVMYQDSPAGKQLCSSDDFNNGSWVHQSIGLESNTVDGISSFAGYHCNWDFPHRCYRRSDPVIEFNRSKTM